ncbi:endonuclease/exonuclease/phosphatase family protein [Streptomyces uncialis]|uniref:endonuclease/exonuclease/phosphatase family protein n=1 Tax=Streptomyces uncialis TaxID=1048205 RepID=UPI00378741D2
MRVLRTFAPLAAALLGLLAGAVPAGALSAGAVPRATAAQAGTATYKLWHWNISGHDKHLGKPDHIVSTVLGSLSFRNPDFISVNEVCPAQYQAILKGLQNAGWPQNPANFARFEPMPHATADLCAKTPGSPDQDPYGVAVFSRFAPSGTDRITLPPDGQRARKLLCVPIASKPGHPRFCTTHVTYQAATKQAQLDTVRTRMEQWTAAGDTVIAAGDFNVQPHDPLMNTWYAPSVNTPDNGCDAQGNHCNTGMFRELDDLDPICSGWGEQTTEGLLAGRCGQPAKVDHIFAAESKLVSYQEDAHPISQTACNNNPCSDHRIVDATVTVSTP